MVYWSVVGGHGVDKAAPAHQQCMQLLSHPVKTHFPPPPPPSGGGHFHYDQDLVLKPHKKAKQWTSRERGRQMSATVINCHQVRSGNLE